MKKTITIEQLSLLWRQAENHFLVTGDDSKKWEAKQLTDDLQLTYEQKARLATLLYNMGI